MQRMHQVPNETMKRMSIPPILSSANKPVIQDLLWISKQQQQHPSTHSHPLKNTVRVASNGIRHKFDGKQWRPLCQSPDGYECRNLAFRSSLCQKHFYKVHLFKRPYGKNGFTPPSFALKPSLPTEFEHDHQQQMEENGMDDELEEIYEDDDDDSIEVIENNDAIVSKQENGQSEPEFSFFSIDSDSQIRANTSLPNHLKPEMSTTKCDHRTEGLDSINYDSSSLNKSIPKVTESIHLGLPPLTRTEEKSLANELIAQLPSDASFTMGEQMARRRACEIVLDNYSHKLLLGNISAEWFYDFLLRNPRIPIHFQSWFSSIKATLPLSDQLIDIKIWELGLVTRSIILTSSVSTSSSPL